MANHAVFVSSNIKATKCGHILNFVHTEDCDNGTIWAKGDLVTGELEIYKAKQAATTDKVYVAGSVPLIYDNSTKSKAAETNFYNENNTVMRMYELVPDDRFEVSVSLIKAASGEVAVGNEVIVDAAAAGKYEEKTKGTAADEVFVADIVAIKTYGIGAGADKRALLCVRKNG